MQKVTEYKAILNGLNRIKLLNPRAVTNLFPNEAKFNFWIEKELLFSVESENSFFLLRRENDFNFLSFVSKDVDSLSTDLKELLLGYCNTYVIDLVSRTGQSDDIEQALLNSGFTHHEILLKMQKINNIYVNESDFSTDVIFAGIEDTAAIHQFMVERLDKYSEQIASQNEIMLAIGQKNILLLKFENEIAGLLIFEKNGHTSHLREWLVNEKYRGMKTGSKLMKRYFFECNDCKRFILWVKEKNEDAINKYFHYGYKFDNLVDKIFLKG